VCGYTFRGSTCEKIGTHYCAPRADRPVLFFAELLLHPTGPLKRTPFTLRPWQEHRIIRPLFGEVAWSQEWGCYVRRYQIGYIVLARKNGKSALLSAIVLFLLVGDDEEGAHIYGAAKDTKQAGKVFEPTLRMAQLSPELNGFTSRARGRLGHNRNGRRLFDERTSSYYETITSDALGELGHNPHGFVLDEVLSQPDGSLWEAMTSARGARLQPLMLAITTETNRPYSFGGELIDEAERVQEDPARAPHVFSYVRKLPSTADRLARIRRLYPDDPDLPVSCDPFDEQNWKWPNPALDTFKSREVMRQEALDARNQPSKENQFRQYQMNQRAQQATRWVPLDLWDENVGEVAASPTWLDEKYAGLACDGGLDLSSKFDLTAWCLLFDDGSARWRFWVPEAVVSSLDESTGGVFAQWVRNGWVTATDGDVIDYEKVYADVEADAGAFAIRSVTYDKWSGEPVRQEIERRTGMAMFESATTYERMTRPMVEFMRMLKGRELRHGGNPVVRWMADNLEAKSPTDDPDRVRPVKPDRAKSGLRIDGIPALFFAIDGRMADNSPGESAYEDHGLEVV
jgi:phage terminase large subunit-like protein